MCAGWTEHLLKKDTYDKTMISNDDKDKDKEEPRNDQETSGSCNTDVSIDVGDFVAAVYRFNSNTYVGKVIRYDEDDACHSWSQVQEKLKYRPHFNGQLLRKNLGISWIYCVSFPAIYPCHRIPSEENHHLALIKARSSQYKN